MSGAIGGLPTMRITPSATPGLEAGGTGADGGFAGMLQSALRSAVDTGHAAENAAMTAITQGGDLTQVATALSRAELTLQTATAVRDRMLQAYQDIMRMQI